MTSGILSVSNERRKLLWHLHERTSRLVFGVRRHCGSVFHVGADGGHLDDARERNEATGRAGAPITASYPAATQKNQVGRIYLHGVKGFHDDSARTDSVSASDG